MENNNYQSVIRREGGMDLPPGFRFFPRDDELVMHYLSRKVLDVSFSPAAIAEVDMNRFEPWELPRMAKMGEREWYFFCVRDRKYLTGQRTNRATPSGYWKATGKDREIYNGDTLVGMKKTLVFYQGRAPRGEKSNWVCHEFRLDGNINIENLLEPAQNDWVIVRVFQKTPGGERADTLEVRRAQSAPNEMGPPPLPVEVPPQPEEVVTNPVGSMPGDAQNVLECSVDSFDNPFFTECLESFSFPPGSFTGEQFVPIQGGMGFQYPGWENPFVFGTPTGNDEHNLNQGYGTGEGVVSQGNEVCLAVSNFEMGEQSGFGGQAGPSRSGSGSVGLPQDLGCFWD